MISSEYDVAKQLERIANVLERIASDQGVIELEKMFREWQARALADELEIVQLQMRINKLTKGDTEIPY